MSTTSHSSSLSSFCLCSFVRRPYVLVSSRLERRKKILVEGVIVIIVGDSGAGGGEQVGENVFLSHLNKSKSTDSPYILNCVLLINCHLADI